MVNEKRFAIVTSSLDGYISVVMSIMLRNYFSANAYTAQSFMGSENIFPH